MNSIKIKANAKINLFLEITGKRSDGYHLLNTVMQSVSLSDFITITKKGSEITLFCDNTLIPTNEKNIAHKAACAFFDRLGEKRGIEIGIEKHIPCEAGMGGGSADGAAVLFGLNELFGKPFPIETLCEIGVKIGADVPFCLVGGTKICEGIGEIFTPLSDLSECSIVLVQPKFTCDTKSAFRLFDEKPVETAVDFSEFKNTLIKGDLVSMGGKLYNVFECLCKNPEIDEIKHIFKSNGSLGSVMTGSGSVVFGIFEDEKSAQSCVKALNYPFVSVTKPTKQSLTIVL